MKPKRQLTDEQKEFIRNNFHQKTYMEFADHFSLKSVYLVTEYCRSEGLKKPKAVLTDEQKEFVRNHYLTMREVDMVKELKVPHFTLQQFKREEKLFKQPWNVARERKEEPQSLFFNVDARECWLY